jgi:hypothetical protein
MRIEYVHASKFGHGAMVAEEFRKDMAARQVPVEVHHIRDVDPKQLPAADLYVFSSPGRFGKPIGEARRFLKKVDLPAGTRYAVFTTEAGPQQATDEADKWQRVTPMMIELLDAKGLTKVAEGKACVTGLKGPLEDGWQKKVEAFAARIASDDRQR